LSIALTHTFGGAGCLREITTSSGGNTRIGERISREIREIVASFPLTANSTQIRKHIFETRIANALLAFSGSLDAPGEAIGFALYFFNFSTWTGRPGLYVRRSLGSSKNAQNSGVNFIA
jgi:hypothetical protein